MLAIAQAAGPLRAPATIRQRCSAITDVVARGGSPHFTLQRERLDEVAARVAALTRTRHHMVHARAIHNPPDFHVDASRVNPWNDPLVSDADGVRYALETSALYGTPARVADQVAELRDAGAHHILCQMSTGYLPHAQIMESMRVFGEKVAPRFR